MKLLEVQIIKYSHEYFPGWVTCSFIDAFGETWYIDEKVPVISSDNITEKTKFPLKGYVEGEVISQDGNIVCFCTEKPWGIEARGGKNRFYIFESQMNDTIDNA